MKTAADAADLRGGRVNGVPFNLCDEWSTQRGVMKIHILRVAPRSQQLFVSIKR
jgi:hypothetical protein